MKRYHSGNYTAGNGDDDFCPATKEQCVELKKDEYLKYQEKIRNFIESLYN